ncbi:MAG: hypothetical protein KBA61_02755, partial [Spirochaetes bacterium]|nr:hypothetical protein [Spirochaetota bacterium]
LMIELIPERLASLGEWIIRGPASRPAILCLGNPSGDAERRELLDLGISDLLPTGDHSLAMKYAGAMIESGRECSRGRVLVLEEEGPFTRVLESITGRYGYSLDVVGSIDALFASVAEKPAELVLVNIGARGFDMAEFVKKAYSGAEIKKYPLIAYKDMKEGLFVHEVTTGLNRLTKTILSRDELLNLLITLFYRNETGPLLGEARALLDADSPVGADTSTLRRLFYAAGPELCTMTKIFDGGRFSLSLDTCAALYGAVLKTAGFTWMITPPRDCPTCGGGASV